LIGKGRKRKENEKGDEANQRRENGRLSKEY